MKGYFTFIVYRNNVKSDCIIEEDGACIIITTAALLCYRSLLLKAPVATCNETPTL